MLLVLTFVHLVCRTICLYHVLNKIVCFNKKMPITMGEAPPHLPYVIQLPHVVTYNVGQVDGATV